MKTIIVSFILLLLGMGANAQIKYYNSLGKKVRAHSEEVNVNISEESPSNKSERTKADGVFPITLIVPAFNLAITATQTAIKNKTKKFSSEYIGRGFVWNANDNNKRIQIKKTIHKKDTSILVAQITLEQKKVYFDRSNLPKDTNQIVPFRFVVTEFIFNYSKAKVSPKHPLLHLDIEISCNYLNKGEKVTQKSNPIRIPNIKVSGKESLPLIDQVDSNNYIYASDVFFQSQLLEVQIKIKESNAHKILSEETSETISNYKGDSAAFLQALIDLTAPTETTTNTTPTEN